MTFPSMKPSFQAVDKVGRTARRTVDTHIKNVLSKPHIATTIRRMTAMFNFLPDLRGFLTPHYLMWVLIDYSGCGIHC